MINPVKPRADRILKPIGAYQSGDFCSLPQAEHLPESIIAAMGPALGVYVNGPNEQVIVTNSGLIITTGKHTDHFRFDDIQSAKVDGEDKQSAEQIVVKLKNGTSHVVPIKHGSGRTRDVWEFWRFLDRAYRSVQAKTPDLESARIEFEAKGARNVRAEQLSQGKILVIAGKDLGQQIQGVLKNNSVDTALSEPEGADRLRATHYDVVILDCQLPALIGADVVQRIRSLSASTRILLVTAGRRNSRDESESDADDYLVAPFQPQELASRVMSLLRCS